MTKEYCPACNGDTDFECMTCGRGGTRRCKACNGELIGVEVLGRYDGISHRECKECKKKYSRIAYKELARDELCRYGKIYKVKGVAPYTYRTLSEREDI